MAEPTDKEKEALRAAGASEERIKELSGAVKGTTESLIAFDQQIDGSASVLETLNEKLKEVGGSIKNMGNLVGAQKTNFGLLTAAIINTKEEFKNLSGADRLGTIGDSVKTLIGTIGQLPVGSGLANKAIEKLKSTLIGMGAGGKAFEEAISGGANSLIKFASSFVTGADNALRFQGGFLKAVAASGSFGKVLDGNVGNLQAVGRHLEGLNKASEQFTGTMMHAAHAVGIESADAMAEFTMQLISTKAGVDAMAKGMDIAGLHTDALTAIIRLADGAMIDRKELLQDISKISNEYGISTVKATELMVRQREVSDALGATQGDVHDALMKTLGAYKMFTRSGIDSAKMTQGLTDSVKSWAAALEKAGVSAHNATELGAKYTSQLKDMDEAQGSFINQQTGGSGGLLGNLEFEQLLAKDPAAASAKAAEAMRMEMKKQGFNQIISKEQAIQMGEAGARQYQFQRELTKTGIFGAKAQSKEESDAMIGALASGADIGKAMSTADKEKILAETAETGRAAENLTRTAVKEANITATEASIEAGVVNLGTLQNAVAAGSGGIEETGRGINTRTRGLLERSQMEAQTRSQGPGTAQVLANIGNLTKDATTHAAATFDSFKRQMTRAPTADTMLKETGMNVPPKGGAITPDQKQKMIEDEMRRTGKTKEQATAYIESPLLNPDESGTTGAQLPPPTPGLNKQGVDALTAAMHRGSPTASRQVGQAIPPATTAITTGAPTAATGGAPGLTAGPGGPVPVSLAPGTAITVNFSGTCLHCGRPMHQNEHGLTNNAASGASNKGVP